MSIYKVIIADDEEEVREGIINKIEWAELGFRVVGSAANGLEALELAETQTPDLVITDIKMPYISGLEMLERVTHLLPAAKTVVLSGFDEFEYAQQAIRLGVTEYLLKPINAEQMAQVLCRIKCEMDGEFAARRDLAELKRGYRENLPILRDQFLMSLMKNRMTAQKIREGIEQYNLDIRADMWAIALLQANVEEGGSLQTEEELIPISLKNLVDEMFGRYSFRYLSFICEDCVAAVLCVESEADIKLASELFNDVCRIARQVLSMRVCAGIGSARASLTDIGGSFREARSALGYRTAEEDQVILITDVEPNSVHQVYFSDDDCRVLTDAVKFSSQAEVQTAIDSLFSYIEKNRIPYSDFQLYALEMFTTILRLLHSYHIPTEDIFGDQTRGFDFIFTTQSHAKIKKWMLDIALCTNEAIRGIHRKSSKSLIDKTRDYVEKNYRDPSVSLETVCNYLHVSGAYFSRMFKRAENCTFITYLTDFRLNKAMDLLNTTSEKTYAIAEYVGYPEANYFSYVFKKKFGVSPSKFRSQNERSGNTPQG